MRRFRGRWSALTGLALSLGLVLGGATLFVAPAQAGPLGWGEQVTGSPWVMVWDWLERWFQGFDKEGGAMDPHGATLPDPSQPDAAGGEMDPLG